MLWIMRHIVFYIMVNDTAPWDLWSHNYNVCVVYWYLWVNVLPILWFFFHILLSHCICCTYLLYIPLAWLYSICESILNIYIYITKLFADQNCTWCKLGSLYLTKEIPIPVRCESNLKIAFSSLLCELISWVFLSKLVFGEGHKISLTMNE